MDDFHVNGTATMHPKILKAGNAAVGAWARMGAWAAGHRTDGLVPFEVAKAVAPAKLLRDLIAAGLLEEIAPDYRVHDYLTHNPSLAEINKSKASERKRKRDQRSPKEEQLDLGLSRGTTGHVPGVVPGSENGGGIDLHTSTRGDREREKGMQGGEGEGRGGCAWDVPTVGPDDLLQIYDVYPRKEGKTVGLSRLKRSVKTPDDLARCQRAVRNYAAGVLGKALDYVKHFSSWASVWEDYVDAPPPRAKRDVRFGRAEPAPHNAVGDGGMVDEL